MKFFNPLSCGSLRYPYGTVFHRDCTGILIIPQPKGPHNHITYLSSILGNIRLAFGSILGSYRDYSTPNKLKVTYSETPISVSKEYTLHYSRIPNTS